MFVFSESFIIVTPLVFYFGSAAWSRDVVRETIKKCNMVSVNVFIFGFAPFVLSEGILFCCLPVLFLKAFFLHKVYFTRSLYVKWMITGLDTRGIVISIIMRVSYTSLVNSNYLLKRYASNSRAQYYLKQELWYTIGCSLFRRVKES